MAKKFVSVELRENEEDLLKVAEIACKVLDVNHAVPIKNPRVLLTIGYVFLKNLMENIGENKVEGGAVQINFVNLFELGISHRETEGGEKEGNYVPFMKATEVSKSMITK